MNDYIATELNSNAITQKMLLLRQKKQELENLKAQLSRIRNNDEQKKRKQREKKTKENEMAELMQQLFTSTVDENNWMYRQNLCAAVSCCLRNSALDYAKFEQLWRNKIINKGNSNGDQGLVTTILHTPDVQNLFKESFQTGDADLAILPPHSFQLTFQFILAKPYISKDDKVFYVCENPIRKDKVFSLPVKDGGSWKGNMRCAAQKNIEFNNANATEKRKERLQLIKLFGHENETEKRFFDMYLNLPFTTDEQNHLQKWVNKDGLRKGRLNFYPSYFDRIGLEVINPHERTTKAGKLPVYIETVPAGTSGLFSLLYLPFDLLGMTPEEINQEVLSDLKIIPTAIRKMMRTYGFSAKKSSGFGIAGAALGHGNLKSLFFTDSYRFADFNQMAAGFEKLKQEVEAHAGR
jgi:CRISPR-associated protein Cmr2